MITKDQRSEWGKLGASVNKFERKLTDEQINSIRHDTRMAREIAKDYPVSASYIRKIKRGEVRNDAEAKNINDNA